ncbi:A/G-specific adenine glycosylase [Desulfuromonas thiophila]|uniref:A/G-specific adenine glycosylase n=1 Tax=Desulfuromonas thiophila TaxID=57664 RepID=UPI0024A8266E|nr:A/G-specific adenine glycosylase [Desulfuromonas thiophila]
MLPCAQTPASEAPGPAQGCCLTEPAALVTDLLAWYRRCGRDLPWRRTRDPYRIWLSEIMLQQTGVQAVQDYYRRFLERFPNLAALAAASLDEVLALWAGLGYYSRARNLHATACQLVAEQQGCFPMEVEQLMQLPGIGRSTAGAIRSIAFDRPGAILDGNVRRVLCRLLALQLPPRSPAAERQLWHWAERLTPTAAAHDYAQAIMDLGALICRPRQPDCDRCPLVAHCHGRRLGLQQQLPLRSRRSAVPVRLEVALLIETPHGIAVRQRPLRGLLGGLWEFPCLQLTREVDAATVEATLLQQLQQQFGLRELAQPLGQVRHVYSHFRLQLFAYRLLLGGTADLPADWRWLTPEQLSAWPLHGSHAKILPLLSATPGRALSLAKEALCPCPMSPC